MRGPRPSSHPPPARSASPTSSLRPGRRTCSSSSSAASRSRPERARPISATTDQTTSSPPSGRESCPSTAKANRGSGAIAVQTANLVGSSTRIGAISPPSPATPRARNVTPPANVPAAAPGNPFAVAAVPPGRSSASKRERTLNRQRHAVEHVALTGDAPLAGQQVASDAVVDVDQADRGGNEHLEATVEEGEEESRRSAGAAGTLDRGGIDQHQILADLL